MLFLGLAADGTEKSMTLNYYAKSAEGVGAGQSSEGACDTYEPRPSEYMCV